MLNDLRPLYFFYALIFFSLLCNADSAAIQGSVTHFILIGNLATEIKELNFVLSDSIMLDRADSSPFSTNLLKVVWIYRFQTFFFDKIVFTSCVFRPHISRIVQIVQQQLCYCVVFEYQE